jgi:hypothetical protein
VYNANFSSISAISWRVESAEVKLRGGRKVRGDRL